MDEKTYKLEVQVWQRAAELLAEVARYGCEEGRVCDGCPMFGIGDETRCDTAATRLAWAVRTARAELEAKT